VKSLVHMGIDTSPANGFIRNRGLRILGGGLTLELPWPELASYPDHGLVRPRKDFDELLARQAQKAGARLHELTNVTGPVLDAAGRVIGVTAKVGRTSARSPTGRRSSSPPTAAAPGWRWRSASPSATTGPWGSPSAATSPARARRRHARVLARARDSKGGPAARLRLGVRRRRRHQQRRARDPQHHRAWQDTDYSKLLASWTGGMPEHWQFDEEHAVGPVRGGALPMGFSRTPALHARRLLVGDAGGAVNPFNGEGIAYAMESGLLAAEIAAQALAARRAGAGAARCRAYPQAMKDAYGGYYTLGRVFVGLIGHPQVMHVATKYGLPRPLLMKFTLKLLANLTDPRGGDALDRVINGLVKVAPAA
jgi:hypothetical protein